MFLTTSWAYTFLDSEPHPGSLPNQTSESIQHCLIRFRSLTAHKNNYPTETSSPNYRNIYSVKISTEFIQENYPLSLHHCLLPLNSSVLGSMPLHTILTVKSFPGSTGISSRDLLPELAPRHQLIPRLRSAGKHQSPGTNYHPHSSMRL